MYLENPKFWNKSSPNFFVRLFLKPLSRVYSKISKMNYEKPYEYISESAKVVAVGAVTMGGSGKTVVTSAICDIFNAANKKNAVLSRGYGRKSNEILLVNPDVHTFEDVGDEPLLLARKSPVIVGKNRGEAMHFANQRFNENFDFFILDDGIMQKSLRPDIRLVVIDSRQKFGNGEVFPLGPNRIFFEDIKHDIDAIIYLRNEGDAFIETEIDFKPVITGIIKQDYSKIDLNQKFYAFCGIGYPKKFFDSLKNLDVVKIKAYPDHYPYSVNAIYRLEDEAQNLGARLITTEKDLMRIPAILRKFITAVPVKIVWDNEEEIKKILWR